MVEELTVVILREADVAAAGEADGVEAIVVAEAGININDVTTTNDGKVSSLVIVFNYKFSIV